MKKRPLPAALKVARPAGVLDPKLRKSKLPMLKSKPVSSHKQRARWFQARATWPRREPPLARLAKERARASRLAALPGKAQWECIGPTNIGGRLTSIVVHAADAERILVGAAGGGVWASDDAGRSWRALWHKRDLNVGSLAVDPSRPEVVLCGTGEANLSADSYPGVGLYRSENFGRSWRLLACRCE